MGNAIREVFINFKYQDVTDWKIVFVLRLEMPSKSA